MPVQPADPVAPFSPGRADRIAMWLGPILTIALFIWMSRWSDAGRANPELAAVGVLVSAAPWALLWVVAAIGLGWPARLLLARESPDALAIQCGIGVALLLFLDSAMGTSGLLQLGPDLGAWAIVLIGVALAAEQVRRRFMNDDRVEVVWPWPVWAAAPSLAVVLVATTEAPGWLWATEFGGYDAMSYHLQLPKEWLSLGAIVPLDHNVYSHFPSFMEGAYYHLAVLIGDGIESVHAAQVLHALLAGLTALLAGRFGVRLAGLPGGLIAGLMVLGTPWVIVTGTLGYNEMAMTLMLITGLLIVHGDDIAPPRQAALIGLACGAAVGAKLTALGLVALPLLLLLLSKRPARQWPATIAIAGAFGVIILSPWLITNALDTGNPFFPFLTGLFGTGHWTAEQAATWIAGHRVEGGLPGRLADVVHQFVRFGIGPNPDAGEPWKPQWSILPWLGALALAMGLGSAALRATSARLLLVLFVQLLFWAMFTHVKSRFMLPAVIPLSLGLAIAFAWLRESFALPAAHRAAMPALFVLLLAWCAQPAWLFRRERIREGGPAFMIGMVDVISGSGLGPQERLESGRTMFVATYINYLVPREARILAVGYATPLYLRRPVEYQTTWDRGALSRIMRGAGENPAAWIEALRAEGYTHLLVEPRMLINWEANGWNDPLITADRILGAADLHADPEVVYPNGTAVYRLR